MEINYNEEADAVYIKLKEGEFAKNKKVNDYVILDMDAEGAVLGIELLEASKKMSKQSLSEVKFKDKVISI